MSKTSNLSEFPFHGITWEWRRLVITIRHAFIFENLGDWCSCAGLNSAEPLTIRLSGERNLELSFLFLPQMPAVFNYPQ